MSRRALLGVAALAAALAVAVAPDPEAPGPALEVKEVTSTTLTCPEAAVTADSATVVGTVVAEGVSQDPDGSAHVRRIDSAESDDADVAVIAVPSSPVHVLVAGRSQPAFVTQARGGWAPQVLSGIAARDLGGAGAGLSSVACPIAAPEWWFVGAGSQVGRGASLLVGNPGMEPARFDVRLIGRSGQVDALAGKGIDVPARGEVRLRLDALAPDEVLLAVGVTASHGRVAAALWDVAVPVEGVGRGVDFIPPAAAPARDVVVAGIPGGEGSRELVLVNPSGQFATVTTRLLTEDGPVRIEDLATVAVPAGSLAAIDLSRLLAGRAGSLHLVSDTPVTGGVRSTWGGTRRDFMWLSTTPTISSATPLAGAAAVPAGPGLTTTVVVAAPAGVVTGTLVVARTGDAAESVFAEDGGPLGAGDLSGIEGGTVEVVLPGERDGVERIPVLVPDGSQRTITTDLTGAAVASLWWIADASSAPAAISHMTLDAQVPLATGYQWWPSTSYVRTRAVRPDIGTLVGR